MAKEKFERTLCGREAAAAASPSGGPQAKS